MKTLYNNAMDSDGNDFLRGQMRQEQKLSRGLNLGSKIQAKLQERHSVQAIASFFDTYADVITDHYYLYWDDNNSEDTSPTPSPFLASKTVCSLGSFKYYLFSQQEYDTQTEVSKDAFLDIRRRRPSSEKKRKNNIIDVLGDAKDTRLVSLKRSSEDSNAIVGKTTQKKHEQRPLKRHKKGITVEEALYQLEMERKLRELNEQIQAKKIAILRQGMKTLMEENAAKDKEIARHINENDRKQRTQTSPTKRFNPPKRAPAKKRLTKKQLLAQQQQNELAIVPIEEVVVTAESEEVLRARREADELFAIQMAQFDAQVEERLLVFSEGGFVNVGIVENTVVRLAAYIDKFLDGTRAPNYNHTLRELVQHPFLATYRVNVMANVPNFMTYSDHEQAALFINQKNAVFNTSVAEVRYNISNVNIHAAFLAKAITFLNDDKMKYRPIIQSNFEHSYGNDVQSQWYPLFNSGNGYIVTPDLKIPAIANLQGQGHGKNCCYCNLKYIACRNGVIKHAHQVKNCDYIANMSNNEYVIISTILTKTLTCEPLREHEFIALRNEHSLFRHATPDEESRGLYVYHAPTNERLRINMPVLLAMRARTYTDFLTRIDVLDTHIKEEMNLNAKPFFFQPECFMPLATTTKKKKKASVSTKTKKENGFLYKMLLDYTGAQFRVSKFSTDGKKNSLRDFTTLDQDGFADSMYFSAPPVLEQQQNIDFRVNEYITQNRVTELGIEMEPKTQQVEEIVVDQEEAVAVVPQQQQAYNNFLSPLDTVMHLIQSQQQQQQAEEPVLHNNVWSGFGMLQNDEDMQVVDLFSSFRNAEEEAVVNTFGDVDYHQGFNPNFWESR